MPRFSALDFCKVAVYGPGDQYPQHQEQPQQSGGIRGFVDKHKKTLAVGAAGLGLGLAAGSRVGHAAGGRSMLKKLSDPKNLGEHVMNLSKGKKVVIKHGRELSPRLFKKVLQVKGLGTK